MTTSPKRHGDTRQAIALVNERLPECADCIEAHPYLDGSFVLATYQVDQTEVDRELRSKDEKAGEVADHHEATDISSSPPYTRRGLLRLYQTRKGEADSLQAELQSETAMAAVLDAKWSLAALTGSSRLAHSGLLAVAAASGHVTLNGLAKPSQHSTRLELNQVADFMINPRQALCLSLDWSDRRSHYPSNLASKQVAEARDASLIVSQSDGSLAHLPSIHKATTGSPVSSSKKPQPEAVRDDAEEDEDEEDDPDDVAYPLTVGWEEQPTGLETWHAHDHEAWIAAFDTFSEGRVVWSGGDDLAMKGWDVRTPIRKGHREATFVTRKCFDGGVTTMQSHWNKEHLWAVGSYDSTLRLFDARMPMKPASTLELPGGIWRLKWHPKNSNLLLAGCMHGGFVVVNVEENHKDLAVVTTFDGHDSLAYGCDWDRGEVGIATEWAQQAEQAAGPHALAPSTSLVYSCSFYDKKLCAWLG